MESGVNDIRYYSNQLPLWLWFSPENRARHAEDNTQKD